ncbi:hypothetical protein [Leptospira perolatii]|nr:hypothetical protein [Leptospira perolatii]
MKIQKMIRVPLAVAILFAMNCAPKHFIYRLDPKKGGVYLSTWTSRAFDVKYRTFSCTVLGEELKCDKEIKITVDENYWKGGYLK